MKHENQTEQPPEMALEKMNPGGVLTEPVTMKQPTSLDILDAAVRGGVTSENVAVVREIIAMRREEVAAQNKTDFNRDFFALKMEISRMDFYADKVAKTDSGVVVYSYCSESEIAGKLEPVLFKHGFSMLFSQRQEADKVIAVITLIHKGGHEFPGEYAVRSGGTNRMKDATAADTGATTSAWRHLMIKMFGLKSRIQDSNDPRNLGGKITPEQAEELERRVVESNSSKEAFLKLAGAPSFSEIHEMKYDLLDQFLRMKEKKGK